MLSLKKNSHTTHYSKLLLLAALTGMLSLSAWAEPRVQPGETLESLSKARVMTTVNGQNASLENLVNSGQIRLVQPSQTPAPAQDINTGMPSEISQDPALMRRAPQPGMMQQPNDPATLPEMQQDSPMAPAEPALP